MNNTLIKASAGTGKTFALTTHIIRLLLSGTPPHALVALTFSRAAAGEIFNRVAERLAQATLSHTGAANESRQLFDRIDPAWHQTICRRHGIAPDAMLPPACFAVLLRSLVHSQHISRIGTIDSFLTQMVRLFPVELGLQGSMTILSDYQIERERRKAADALLAAEYADDQGSDLLELFNQATCGREIKRFSAQLDQIIAKHHERYLCYPDKRVWGQPEAIWPTSGNPFATDRPLNALMPCLERQLVDPLPDHDPRRTGWQQVVTFLRTFNGSSSDMPTPFKNLLAAWDGKGRINTFNCNRAKVTPSPSEEALLAGILRAFLHESLRIRCERTQGVYRVLARLDQRYARTTRQRGRLTFGDIPRMITQLKEVPRLNVEYRFDCELQHWALDEFQDTSHDQWQAIRNLITEAKMDDHRTVFLVGDAKQAIYGWRGGTCTIFETERHTGHYQIADLLRSHRYAPEIAACVNRIFNADAIARLLRGSRGADAAEQWRAVWGEHTSAVRRTGCVAVCEVPPKASGETSWEGFIPPVRDELLRIKPWTRGITTALLVRSNSQGAAFAEALRHAGIPVIWEGESDIADTPVVQAFLNLLRVAEHPDNTLAWQHLCATPLLAIKAFHTPGGTAQEHVAHVAATVADDVSRLGLARALRGYAEAMDETFDAFTRGRVNALIRAAAQAEALADTESSLTDFADFVAAFKTRDVADATVVKLLTIHRAKGLGFDYVLAPFPDTQPITSQRLDQLVAPDRTWLLSQAPALDIVERDPTLSRAFDAACTDMVYEQLCVYYVCMTRAKQALSLFVRMGGSEHGFGNHIAAALDTPLPCVFGDAGWYQTRTAEAASNDPLPLPTCRHRPRRIIRRATPSTLSHAGRCAAALFDERDTGAAERGIAIHALLSRITWLDEDTPEAARVTAACHALGVDLTRASSFRDALTRPQGVLDLWRERSFEMLCNDTWTSGTIDRVVFLDIRGETRAIVYDFKSNRRQREVSEEVFAQRMAETYAPQLIAYRAAVARLARLPAEAVATSLLLTDTLTCVPLSQWTS